MEKYSRFLKTNALGSELSDILQQPLTILLGVNAASASALKDIGIETVFDLGASWLFANAASVSETNDLNHHANSTALPVTGMLKANTVFQSTAEIPNLSLAFLNGLTDDQASTIQNALSVTTIREFAYWPPRQAAQQLVAEVSGSTVLEADHAEALRPKLGEYPTERVYYDTLTMLQMDQEANQAPIENPISLMHAVNNQSGFNKPAVGVLLTYSQSWYAKGVTLGHMLHSLALAPGEATRIAVVDWSRRTSATTSESIAETEQLDNATQHARAISEVQNAVASELQSGGSMSSGWAQSSSSSEVTADSSGFLQSVLGSSGSGSDTTQESTTSSRAQSTSWSIGTRSISADMTQNVNDRTEQFANSVRNRRATAVREVSQSEHESVSTRIIANYNHMHAMTVQYYEVVQVYEVATQLHAAQRCIFIPFEFLRFDQADSMDVVERFRGSLLSSALTKRARDLLFDHSTMVAIKPFNRIDTRQFHSTMAVDQPSVAANPANQPVGATDGQAADDNAGDGNASVSRFSQNRPEWNRNAVLKISKVIGRSPFRPGNNSIYLPDETELLGLSFDSVNISSIRLSRPGIPTSQNTFSVAKDSSRVEFPAGIRLTDIEEISAKKSTNPAASADLTLYCAFKGRPFTTDTMLIKLKSGTAMQKVVALESDEPDRQQELLAHLQENRSHYSQRVFENLDSATLVMLLSPFSWNGKPLTDQVEPKPIAAAGNFLVFKAPIDANESSGVTDDGVNLDWQTVTRNRGIEFDTVNARLVPVPTGGVFAEAVLGRSNSAEKLDITRFWNWQDSPIPLQPPEIAPVGVGSRGTSENLTPGDLSAPILNVVNPTNLPDPAGLSSSLGAIANSNLFRDMSGLQGTQGLAESGQSETLAATTQAGQLASTNLQAEAQKVVALSQIASDIAKAAMGIPPTGSTDGISADGARINHGKDLDDRGVSNGTEDDSGSVEATTQADGAGDNNFSRERSAADRSNLGFSPDAVTKITQQATKVAQFAHITPPISQSFVLRSPIGTKSEKILQDLYPGGEMKGVRVLPYSANPNPLIRTGVIGDYEAWTQNEKLMYVQDKYVKPSAEPMLKYVLKHEAIHILQFTKNPGKNFSFIDMLNAELDDYGDTAKWTMGQTPINQVANEAKAKDVLNGAELKKIKKAAGDAVTYVKNIEILKDNFFVHNDLSFLVGKKAYLKNFLQNSPSEDRCAQIAFIAMDALPVIKNNKVYSVRDLYLQLPKNDPNWAAMGY